MKKLILPAALLLSSAAFAKIEMSGYITPAFKMGADSASDAYTNELYIDDVSVVFEGQVNDNLTGTFALWAKQDVIEDTTLYSLVDEAYLTQKMGDAYLKGGWSYLPFGDTSTMFLTDSATYQFGTMQRTMIEAGYDWKGLSVKAFAYNRPQWAVKADEKAGLNSYGANVSYEHEMFTVGAGYISNMAGAYLLGLDDSGTLEKVVGAYSVNGSFNYMGFSLLASYMMASGDFNTADAKYTKNGADKKITPSALNLELGYTYAVMGKDVTVGVGYQMQNGVTSFNDDSGNATTQYLLPTQILLAGANIAMDANSTVKLEYRQATDEKADKGGQTDGHTASKFSLAYNLNF